MSAYISSIHIKNFKSLIGPVDIDLKPLTFFYGPNSAGKSAVSAAIDLLRQFCEAGEPIKIQALKSLIRNQDFNNLLSLGLTVSYNEFPYENRFNSHEFGSLFNDLEDNFRELFCYFKRENYNELNKAKDYSESLDVSVCFHIMPQHSSSSEIPWSYLIDEMAKNLDMTISLESCPDVPRLDVNGIDFPRKGYWITEIKVGSDVLIIMTWEALIFNLDHEAIKIIDRSLACDGLSFAKIFEGWFEVHRFKNFLGSGPEHYVRDGYFYINDNCSVEVDAINEPSRAALWTLTKDLIQFLVMIPMHICAATARSTVHLGPIRNIPVPRELTFLERDLKVYATTESSNPKWHWYDGSAAWKKIVDSVANEKMYFLNYIKAKPLFSVINEWLTSSQRLGLRHSVFVTVYNTREINSHESDIEDQVTEVIESIPERLILVRLRDETLGIPVDVRDVGAGVPQIVPVLVAGLVAECSFIEQPELHLHPRLQTEIADFFISVINNQGHRCIIETHSEHLALRTLRRVRETHSAHIRHRDFSLENESVAFYYFNPVEGGTEITRLRVSPEGDFLDRWPRGFFSEREAEIFDDDD